MIRDICEMANPAAYVRNAKGADVGSAEDISNNDVVATKHHFLAPCDLQTIKACGVTFASSMIERVIEEQAVDDLHKAQQMRGRIGARVGDSLSNIIPGSYAEVFLKAQVPSPVGRGERVGLQPTSS